ncbi:MAG: heme exporter protein CcmB [Myxococcales bacterium]|nr:heme exporter protein CcmB [Myxococcales bacterium]
MRALWRASLALLGKELRIELRTGEVVLMTGLFATLVTVLTSLSFYLDTRTALRVAPGVLWIAVTFAGVLAMGRSWAREREHDVFRGLLMTPMPRAALYLSKVASSLIFLAVVELVLVLQVAVFFNVELFAVALPLLSLLGLGSVGFVATGNLFAALSVRTRARDMMLSVIVFPVVAPALLCGVVATRELFAGAPMSDIAAWMQILGAFDLAFLAAGIALFDVLIQD